MYCLFPGGTVVKNPSVNAGDMALIPGLGRSPGGGNGNLLQYSCLENPMDRGAWQDIVHGVRVRHNWACLHAWAMGLRIHLFFLLFCFPNSLLWKYSTLIMIRKCYSKKGDHLVWSHFWQMVCQPKHFQCARVSTFPRSIPQCDDDNN